jgi:excisionase family DNA binding protein
MNSGKPGRPLAYTVEDAALMLSVSTSMIRSMVKAGTLPHVPGLGRAVRIPSRAVFDLVGEPAPTVMELAAVAEELDPPETAIRAIPMPENPPAPVRRRTQSAPPRPRRSFAPVRWPGVKVEGPIKAGEERLWLLADSGQYRIATWHIGSATATCGKTPAGRWTRSAQRQPGARMCADCLTAVAQMPGADVSSLPIRQVAMVRQMHRGEALVLRKAGWHLGDGRKTSCGKREGPWYLTEREPSPDKMCFECRERRLWLSERTPGSLDARVAGLARWSLLLDQGIDATEVGSLIGQAPGLVVLRRARRAMEVADLVDDWGKGLRDLFRDAEHLSEGRTVSPNFDPDISITVNGALLTSEKTMSQVKTPEALITWLTPIVEHAAKAIALRARWDREVRQGSRGPRRSR